MPIGGGYWGADIGVIGFYAWNYYPGGIYKDGGYGGNGKKGWFGIWDAVNGPLAGDIIDMVSYCFIWISGYLDYGYPLF